MIHFTTNKLNNVVLLNFLPSLLIQVPCIQNNQLDGIMSFVDITCLWLMNLYYFQLYYNYSFCH
jgi:hypothetical protein